jgi:hypothetical protein
MSIIRPSPRLRPSRILIALAATVTLVALVPTAAGAGAPKVHRLSFHLSGPLHQDVIGAGAIEIRARCPTEACTIVAQATSKSPSFRTAKVHAQIPAGAAESISLPLAPRDRGKLKAAFKAGRSPTLTVNAIARDAAGTKVPLSIEVRPSKP